MNKKPTILAVGVLGSLALIGTGFAGWVITAEQTVPANGSITAYEVTDNRVFIDSTVWVGSVDPNTNNRIIFGAADTQEGGSDKFDSPWLTMPGMEHENLSVTYRITGRYTNSHLNIGAKYTVNDSTTGGYAAALANHLITGPAVAANTAFDTDAADPIHYTVTPDGEATDGKHKFILDVVWTFGWGSYFGGENPQNPYDFYNHKTATEDVSAGNPGFNWADDAAEKLAALESANNVGFEFTLKLTTSDTPTPIND